MEKPSYKLVGAPCGQHGQYTFYKGIRLTGKRERIVAIGDFFFVRIWQDSELVSIGELQLLWTDRVSDQTLVSLRLYFLPENTPDGRCQHGEDEVLAINDKVVLRAEDLLTWVCEGAGWRWGLRAVWRGACAPPKEAPATAPLHSTRMDFSDVEREKNAIVVDADSPGVMVFSYPRYCRYRALLSRLEGIQADWLRDSLVAALGGYAAPTRNTRILYCKDTFEYPELEGHEFVCNHLAPKLKGRPRGRRRRARSRSATPSDDEQEHRAYEPATPRRLSLRNGGKHSEDDDEDRKEPETQEDREFVQRLRHFYKGRHESFKMASTLKHLSLRSLYLGVSSRGGYEAVCRLRLWGDLSEDQPARARRNYERFLLPFENHERRKSTKLHPNGKLPVEPETVATIEVHESPPPKPETPEPTSPETGKRDSETGEISLEEKPKITIREVDRLNESVNVSSANINLPQPYDRPAPNGQPPQTTTDQKNIRPAGRSSLRAVRVKPTRPLASAANTAASNPPSSINNFGIHHPPALCAQQIPRTPHSDDEIVEVPYKPKTPEIIDLDEYPESPQSVKRKKLEILKERGLEVTAVPPWPQPLTSPLPPIAPIAPIAPLLTPAPLLLNPVVQHQLLTHAQIIQLYGALPAPPNGTQPPKVIQATSIFGSQGPEKTVYGNPKDPFMPPPHIVHGVPLRAPKNIPQPSTPPHDALDLTCKQNIRRPAVEIVRVPSSPPLPIETKTNLAPNLEITLVGPKSRTPPKRPPQKRSSNGKFASAKTPSPSKTLPTPSPDPPKPPIVDPVYMSALYSSLGQMDQRQLAMYRDFVASQFRGYTGLLNIGTPTTKN